MADPFRQRKCIGCEKPNAECTCEEDERKLRRAIRAECRREHAEFMAEMTVEETFIDDL